MTLASLSLTFLSDFHVLSYIRDLGVFTKSIYQHGSLQWTWGPCGSDAAGSPAFHTHRAVLQVSTDLI